MRREDENLAQQSTIPATPGIDAVRLPRQPGTEGEPAYADFDTYPGYSGIAEAQS